MIDPQKETITGKCPRCENDLPARLASGRVICRSCGWSDQPKRIQRPNTPKKENKEIPFKKHQDIIDLEKDIGEEIYFECVGQNGIILVAETRLFIKRRGGLFSSYKEGQVQIKYEDILFIQHKKADFWGSGFVYLQLRGQEAVREISSTEALINYSSVTFSHGFAKEFDCLEKFLNERIIPQDAQELDNIFWGRNGTLILSGQGVTIKKNPNFFTSFRKDEKSISYKSITAVQFKEAGLTVGFIQFSVLGGVESKGYVMDAVNDENTITFETEEKN